MPMFYTKVLKLLGAHEWRGLDVVAPDSDHGLSTVKPMRRFLAAADMHFLRLAGMPRRSQHLVVVCVTSTRSDESYEGTQVVY